VSKCTCELFCVPLEDVVIHVRGALQTVEYTKWSLVLLVKEGEEEGGFSCQHLISLGILQTG
jgi:hypothetical protein